MDQMKIVVGSLVCQPDPEKQNGIEDRIENIELQNNRTQDIISNYSEKFNYFFDFELEGEMSAMLQLISQLQLQQSL